MGEAKTEAAKHVYVAINAVAGEIARTGISKDRTASAGGGGSYAFRGVDDVYNALAPILAAEKLCILPRVLDRVVTKRTNSKGTLMSYVVLTVEFDLVSSVDGSAHTIRTMGEAMDTGDKATNKAMSAAYKYACFMAFAIPTEGDRDSENNHHEPARGPGPATASRPEAAPSATQPKHTATSAREAETRRVETSLRAALEKAEDTSALSRVAASAQKEMLAGRLSNEARERLLRVYQEKVRSLRGAA